MPAATFQPEPHAVLRARIVALLMIVLALTGFFGGPSRSVGVLCQDDALNRSPLQQQIRVKPRGQWLVRQADTACVAVATRASVAHGRPYESPEAVGPAMAPVVARPWLRALAPRPPTGREAICAFPSIATSGSRAPPAG